MSSNNYPLALDHMLAAWNEQDSTKIRTLLEEALTPDVHFVDPTANLHGMDAFEQNVRDVQQRLPGATYSRVSEVDSHNNLYRYHWAIHLDGRLAVQGFDVTELRDGRVCKVIGFFNDLPLNRSI
ncbi:MAG: nuclear transport factor 2 family protein [Gammaproteobacteria bacterium]